MPTETTTPVLPTSVTAKGWDIAVDGEPLCCFFRETPPANRVEWEQEKHPGQTITIVAVEHTTTTTTVTCHAWSDGVAPIERVVFCLSDSPRETLLDRKGRTVGALVYRFESTIVEVERESYSYDFHGHMPNKASRAPHSEPEAVGTVHYAVQIQAARGGEAFGASFPKTYRFATEAERETHITKKLAQAQGRQWKRLEAGKL